LWNGSAEEASSVGLERWEKKTRVARSGLHMNFDLDYDEPFDGGVEEPRTRVFNTHV